MRVERIITKQAHPVPSQVRPPQGPFPPEVLAQPKIIREHPRQADDGNVADSVDGTAQNNFKPTRWFRCNECTMLVSEAQLETHICEE